MLLLAIWIPTIGYSQEVPAPLYRDPITDGAADPALVYNPFEKAWRMLYTQRRANVETADVAYCYGNEIGIAYSEDNGRTWRYRGTLDLEFERGKTHSGLRILFCTTGSTICLCLIYAVWPTIGAEPLQ
ncbi:MAG: hypothetical protein LUH15_11795 [Tannerellaceae bacterium]|nr:hypothetical protein [Tannerellaceae bacterium]